MSFTLKLKIPSHLITDHRISLTITVKASWYLPSFLEIFASLLVPANEAEIFNPTLWQDDISQLVDYTWFIHLRQGFNALP